MRIRSMHQKNQLPAFATRRIGRVNWIGLWTLYSREVQRFFKVVLQTVLAPSITTLLFLAIFMLALGGADRTVAGVAYADFLVPGLVMMAIVQNSFANTSSSLLISKVQGNIVDVLMPPLSAGELTIAYALGGLTRGLLVAFVVTVPLSFVIDVNVDHPLTALYFAASASLMLSLLGILGGIWSDKFDHLAALTNFVIMPLSFLSGTFYSIQRLPPLWQEASSLNPFFYAIDGFRYAFIDRSDAPILQGATVLFVLNIVLWFSCHWVFKKGYRLKA